ncbi:MULTISPECIES: hypothetical protein [Klebsiella]|nr:MULTISPECIES: hypothetical protein [Klebsiella]MCC5463468.1 hypothetical protein [Klebsiella quasipneumoniae subsp. similipneumoniae]MCS4374677.1 hypothetical protein [Klebsiella quasipneumoniae subsp. similipneumoniae]MCS4416448.1 hypothetical protein [Klebsiella quasipneumoniae subsp. similipneumoniae]MDK1848026.1 hypothetical protein [Klebsiella sp. K5-1]MDK1945631.1 hypothetical protein [Klebsiella sp. K4-32]
MNQMGDLAQKQTIKYAMGQINSPFCGKTGVIFLSSTATVFAGSA